MDFILRFSALRLPRLDAWIPVKVASDPGDGGLWSRWPLDGYKRGRLFRNLTANLTRGVIAPAVSSVSIRLQIAFQTSSYPTSFIATKILTFFRRIQCDFFCSYARGKQVLDYTRLPSILMESLSMRIKVTFMNKKLKNSWNNKKTSCCFFPSGSGGSAMISSTVTGSCLSVCLSVCSVRNSFL